MWPREEDDFITLGESDWVPCRDGWFENRVTEEKMSPDGVIYNKFDEVVFNPSHDEDYD